MTFANAAEPLAPVAIIAPLMLACTFSLVRFVALLVVAVVAGGCATSSSPRDPRDPLEPLNRQVYKFNDAVDRVAVKPAAKAYVALVPPPVRGGLNNVFGNFRDVTTGINNLLQGKVGQAASDAGRVAVNTTVGLFGVFDVASRIGLEKHMEEFGQTLGRWGVPNGPFLVLPFLGPSTVRDSVGLVGDYFTDPQFYLITSSTANWIVVGVRLVNLRANLLEFDGFFNEAALDPYAFLRDAYLQRRRNQIYDGNAPDADDVDGSPARKTLKELEDELELTDPEPLEAPRGPRP